MTSGWSGLTLALGAVRRPGLDARVEALNGLDLNDVAMLMPLPAAGREGGLQQL
jgi:hypothetical protein